ncbi:protein bric-a-brac 1-like [Bradysia coprophila]|uniref:protein bric-a-brac 1-like n=1 Tax=Bradysia coprophila TaxID=38358 RepID=UPI00187D9943|nr:protein bric-a-brac 1-like [Bradysia coprophila]
MSETPSPPSITPAEAVEQEDADNESIPSQTPPLQNLPKLRSPSVGPPSQPPQQQQQQQSQKQCEINEPSSSNPQQFCLRWNNYQSNLTSVFDQLLQNESFVDVTLVCDGHSIKAHKIVLSACSPYFQDLFFENPCKHPVIIMLDIKWPVLKAAVDFMYKGEINVCQDQISPLLRVAEMLKIRGLADVNGNDNEIAIPQQTKAFSETVNELKRQRITPKEWANISGSSNIDVTQNSNSRNRKRRWPSTENNSTAGSPVNMTTTPEHPSFGTSSPIPPNAHGPSTSTPISTYPMQSPLEAIGLSAMNMNHPDDLEIKPEIAEMIREEERTKLMQNTNAWLDASTSASIADSYQYQLQSMWQKCWNTNQNLIHHQRFRERGPLKSWRPETMAEAIFSVLKDGLSLSQAARKYDIPYPTFVLYSNRVHNMLGPSIEGGIEDLRPKGRGRPQRILLGLWPDEHIKGVIKTVVFRDANEMKDDGVHLVDGRPSDRPMYNIPPSNMTSVMVEGIFSKFST